MTVLHDPIDPKAVRAAIDDCLSGLESVPSRRAEILTHVRGEKKVKKKLSAGFVLAIVLTVLMAGAAVAAGLGLFGELTGQDEDVRLGDLAELSANVGMTFTTPTGQTVTIDQAYYDGTRVFLSYKATGRWEEVELGTGKPEDMINAETEEPGVIFGKAYHMEREEGARMMKWLDGSEPRWARYRSMSIHDGLETEDGTYLEIIGGTSYEQPDGSCIGWKECTVPEEAAKDEITVCLGIFGSERLYYQTPDCLYSAHLGGVETTWYPITLQKSTEPMHLTGTAQGPDWSATADIRLNPIDLRGEITVACPASWTAYWQTGECADPALDMITEWVLYIGDTQVEGYDLEGSTGGWTDGEMTYGICWRTGGVADGFRLVPKCRQTGLHPEWALTLTEITE